MNLFGKKKPTPENSAVVIDDPSKLPEPTNKEEFFRRGYAYYGRSRFPEAEADFLKAIEIDPRMLDAYYALGETLKAQKKIDESVKNFNKVIALIDDGVVENHIRGQMLRRMALGHINEMTQGDWNLEKEIWKREG